MQFSNRISLIIAAIIIAVVTLLSIATGFLIKRDITLEKRLSGWQENLYQSLNERDQQILIQTEAQLKKLYPPLDSIAKANNIKHITQVHNTTYHNHLDTVIYTMQPADTSSQYYNFTVDTNCFTLSGIVNCTSSTIQFNQLDYNDNISTFYYWQRQRLFNWSWTPKWGRKQYRAQTVSSCTDSIRTIQITINKN